MEAILLRSNTTGMTTLGLHRDLYFPRSFRCMTVCVFSSIPLYHVQVEVATITVQRIAIKKVPPIA